MEKHQATISSKGDIDGENVFMGFNHFFRSMLMGINEANWMEKWGREGGGLKRDGESIWNSDMTKSED